MPNKTYRVYHHDGKPENIEGSSATHTKQKDGLKIKIGKRVITGAIALVEVIAETKQFVSVQTVDDDE